MSVSPHPLPNPSPGAESHWSLPDPGPTPEDLKGLSQEQLDAMHEDFNESSNARTYQPSPGRVSAALRELSQENINTIDSIAQQQSGATPVLNEDQDEENASTPKASQFSTTPRGPPPPPSFDSGLSILSTIDLNNKELLSAYCRDAGLTQVIATMEELGESYYNDPNIGVSASDMNAAYQNLLEELEETYRRSSKAVLKQALSLPPTTDTTIASLSCLCGQLRSTIDNAREDLANMRSHDILTKHTPRQEGSAICQALEEKLIPVLERSLLLELFLTDMQDNIRRSVYCKKTYGSNNSVPMTILAPILRNMFLSGLASMTSIQPRILRAIVTLGINEDKGFAQLGEAVRAATADIEKTCIPSAYVLKGPRSDANAE
ncbi:uncharacterized protein AB675_8522 [Cyphellophora attinorum]|uniref:Uncharacterized protein n=1 Tax=Cyphellophora attinorum TaxID=1664694 RepID=A0A0N1HZJ7_9EURO|nr:uncharacterized protein AB675_8522 [Phialophora attinorum]KPI44245.1 hypothetical protein AB675_8522 [Phialophora attinorum]